MIRTDDNAPLHSKFQLAGLLAYGWWHSALSYCGRQLTDGFIAARNLGAVFPTATPEEREAVVAALLRERSLHAVAEGARPVCHGRSRACPARVASEQGYVMHDYFVFQKRRSVALRERGDKIKAGRKGGEMSAKTRQHSASASPVVSAAPRSVPIRSVPFLSLPESTSEPTTLSGTPRPTPHAKVATPGSQNGQHGEARAILAFLNDKTGRSYRPVPANLTLIEARLASGATADNIRGVIARKVREWNGDPKMRSYLRPATLFNLTKFEQYLGEKPAPAWGEKPHV